MYPNQKQSQIKLILRNLGIVYGAVKYQLLYCVEVKSKDEHAHGHFDSCAGNDASMRVGTSTLARATTPACAWACLLKRRDGRERLRGHPQPLVADDSDSG